MKNKKIILIPFIFGMLITGCNGENNNSSEPTSEEQSVSTSVSTSVFEGYVDIETAIDNTKYYVLNYNMDEIRAPVEVFLEDMYYYFLSKNGLVELESDKGYLHSFTTHNTSDDTITSVMEVYGRNSSKDRLSSFEDSNFVKLIETYEMTFFKLDDNVYKSMNTSFIYGIADFLDAKVYKYATEIQITVGQNNRLETLDIIESGFTLLSIRFDDVSYKELQMYQLWEASGSVINERIYDYKTLIEQEDGFISCYDGEEVEFEATVVARDVDGAIYVANRDDNVGHIGIKVNPSLDSDNVAIKDIVKVKGVIETENWNAYIPNGKIVDTGKDNEYAPAFDEDALVDSMGGGAYAANLFSYYPYFNDSVYSTFAYVYDMPESLSDNQDTYIDLIFPSQVSGNYTYHMELIIPKNLDSMKKSEIFNALAAAKTYGDSEAYEICIDRFIMKYDYNYQYKLRLMATDDSFVCRRPTVTERINDYLGLADFPIPEGKTIINYEFGGFTNMFLESEYGLDGTSTKGIFLAFLNMNYSEIENFFLQLENYGANKYDEVKDIYNFRHLIYNIGNVNIDILLYEDGFEEGTYTLNIWLYEGTVLKGKDIFERLDEKIGDWFNVDNFLKYSGTYDADYTLFELRTYAGKMFSEDNPLYCVVVDTKEMIFDDYNSALINLGYRQYRVNNKPYTYKSRGQTHYVFYKDDVYLDVANYHTSDYTYTGHKDFEYRLEILIYKGEPMSVETYDDLSILSGLYESIDPSLAYNPTLPSDAKVEIWRNLHDFKIAPVDYGYGSRDEAFVYTNDVEGAYESCKQALIDAGYNISGSEKTKSILFSKTVNDEIYNVLLMKETEKGYLRVFNDIGGVDFLV